MIIFSISRTFEGIFISIYEVLAYFTRCHPILDFPLLASSLSLDRPDPSRSSSNHRSCEGKISKFYSEIPLGCLYLRPLQPVPSSDRPADSKEAHF